MSLYLREDDETEQLGTIPQQIIDDVFDLKEKGYTLLWENPSPTSSFSSQQITFSSDDYDLLLVIANNCIGYSNHSHTSLVVPKGCSLYFSTIETSSSSNISVATRRYSYNSDNKYTIDDGRKQTQGSSRVTDNTYLVPYKIYGIKI